MSHASAETRENDGFDFSRLGEIVKYELNRITSQKKFWAVIVFGLVIQMLGLIMPKILPDMIDTITLSEWTMSTGVLFPTGFFTIIVILAVSFDSIAGDFERDSARILFTKPISKIEVYLGKFIGCFTTVFATIMLWTAAGMSGFVLYESQKYLANVPLTFLSMVYASLVFLAIVFLVNVVTKSSIPSVISVLGVYFAQIIIIPIIQFTDWRDTVIKAFPNWAIGNVPSYASGISTYETTDLYIGIVSILIYTLIPLVAGLLYFNHSDIVE